jgi:hypothetical protein
VTEALAPRPIGPCRNCGFEASGHYCAECGQETDPSPPSVREFANHFFGNYISVKGTFAQSLWRLLSKPGQLTVDYLAGRKRAYILPLRLYLTVSVITLLTMTLLVSSSMQEAKIDLQTKESKGMHLSIGDSMNINFVQGEVSCSKEMPSWICNHAKQRFGGSPEKIKEAIRSLPERAFKLWGYSMFLLMPFFALLLNLVYWNRGLFYGEHLVFALHTHTYALLVLLAASLAPSAVAPFIALAVPVYKLLAMRRVYGGRWRTTLLRSAAITVPYLLATFLVMAVVALAAFLI